MSSLLRSLCLVSLSLGLLPGLTACSSGRVGTDPDPGQQGNAVEAKSTTPGTEPSDTAAAVEKIALDPSQTHQVWEGAGSSLMAWDEQARAQYRSEQWQTLFADDMGMTILRIDLLPTPLSTRGRHEPGPIRFGPVLDDNVKLFDYSRSPRAAIFGEVARDLAARGVPLKVLASVWTPPHWLKDGAKITNNGNDSGGGTLRMDADNLEQYGRYMAAAVTAWERTYGLPIHALSIQNEPRFEQDYSSMRLDPPQYAQALTVVADELERSGMSTRLFGPEDVGYGPAGDHSRIDQQLRFIRAVMGDARAGAAIDAFGVHGYGGDGIDSRGFVAPDNWKYYWSAIEGYGKPSWQTETGGGPAGGNGPVFFANVLFEGMTYGQISLWCNWLFSAGGPIDQHALVGADLNTDQLKYAVAKHYFRYLRPGARRITVEPADREGMRVVAWQHPDTDAFTIVMVNMREQGVPVHLDLGPGSEGRTLRRYQTDASANFAEREPLTAEGTTVVVLAPGMSLTTLTDVTP